LDCHYGTASTGGAYGYGVVFKLALGRDSTWTESVLHAFEFNPGAYHMAGVIFDATGSLYGTTKGVPFHPPLPWGSVFEITP
jgi:uncharacterized repeat protein (TIGR03803 family)